MKRRTFIKTAGSAASIPFFLNGVQLSAMGQSALFSGADPNSDKVLVIIQCSGGNDGLNMVIPVDQYDKLANLRANILIPQDKVLKIQDRFGLHPSMTGMRAMYDAGKLSIVQSAGYPNQNRSHFRSTDIWQSGSPANAYWDSGWAGRYLESVAPGYPEGYPSEGHPHPFAITMGTTVSETCQGTVSNMSLTLNDPFALAALTEGSGSDIPDTPYGDELNFLRTSILQTNAYAEEITASAKKGKNLAAYPANNALATQLKNIALLISGGLQTRVYVARIGGFDTHANQADAADKTRGAHANLLGALSAAIAAFQEDLRLHRLEERVLGLTFSEFGRQIKSNASAGTDHGTAAPLFVFGGCIQTHNIGSTPDIPAQPQNQEGVAMQTDFRDVYGSILQAWFGVKESDVRTMLYNGYTYLPIVKPCGVATPTKDRYLTDAIQFVNFPNPFADTTTLKFTAPGGRIRITLYDSIGSELGRVADQDFPGGEHQLLFDGARLAPGNYYLRFQGSNFVQTGRIVKM
jgi:uncharacterized protein (DUF1501 family)